MFRDTLKTCKTDTKRAILEKKKLEEDHAKREAAETREKARQAKKAEEDKRNAAARMQRDKEKKEFLAQIATQADEARQREQA